MLSKKFIYIAKSILQNNIDLCKTKAYGKYKVTVIFQFFRKHGIQFFLE